MKIVRLPASDPEKFGSKKVRGNRQKKEDQQQLNLFSAGNILQLHSLSPFEEALMMDERGDKDTACRLYRKAIEAGDQVADAYCNLGIMESQESNTVKAIDYLTRSLKYDPRHPEAHFNLANCYTEAGNMELGILHYRITIQIDPAFLNSYFNLGLALASQGRYEEAVAAFDKYCSLTQNDDRKPALEMIRKLKEHGYRELKDRGPEADNSLAQFLSTSPATRDDHGQK